MADIIQFSNSFIFEEAFLSISRNEQIKIRLIGDSMQPFLHSNRDVLTIAPIQDRKLKGGDIILFYYHGNYILHRIIFNIRDQVFILQGDANIKQIEYIHKKDVLGILISIERDNSIFISCKSRSWIIKSWLWVKLCRIRFFLFKGIFVYQRIKQIVTSH